MGHAFLPSKYNVGLGDLSTAFTCGRSMINNRGLENFAAANAALTSKSRYPDAARRACLPNLAPIFIGGCPGPSLASTRQKTAHGAPYNQPFSPKVRRCRRRTHRPLGTLRLESTGCDQDVGPQKTLAFLSLLAFSITLPNTFA